MKNLVIVSFPAKTESLDFLKQSMKDALPDTRAYPGCISVDTYLEESTSTIHLIEDWETLDDQACLLYTSPSPRDAQLSRMPSSA